MATPDKKPKGKKRRRLKDLSVDEVSLVDSPAVPKARFLIAKRDEDSEMADDTTKTEDAGEIDLELFKKMIGEVVNEKVQEALGSFTSELSSIKEALEKQSRSEKPAPAPTATVEAPPAPAETADEPAGADEESEEEDTEVAEEPAAEQPEEPAPVESTEEEEEDPELIDEDAVPEPASEVEKAGLILLQLQEDNAAAQREAVARQDEAAIEALGALSKNIDDMLAQLGDLTNEVKHATGKVA